VDHVARDGRHAFAPNLVRLEETLGPALGVVQTIEVKLKQSCSLTRW
jgi:hypothetical protein